MHASIGIRVLPFVVLGCLALAGTGFGQDAGEQGPPSDANAGVTEVKADVRVMMPSVTLWLYMAAGADSVHVWLDRHRETATDRSALFASLRGLLDLQRRFEDNLAERSYPRDQVEWLLITDAVADTLTVAAGSLLRQYAEAHPEEILTDGRIALEMRMAEITGPPSKLLGFHFVRLSDYAYSRADSILRDPGFRDRTGLEDGVLRYMSDWVSLYRQGHDGPIGVFECRLIQEDWIIARLEDKCGNKGSGTWQLGEQWMAQIPDSSTTPVMTRFAHEYKLMATKCPGDVRVIYIDLPNYREVQEEVQRRAEKGNLESPPTSRP